MSGTLLLLLGCCFSAAEDAAADAATEAFDPRAVALEFVDQSVLKLVLADERIEIVTPHGKLQVPTDDIRRIEFAQHLAGTGVLDYAGQKLHGVIIAPGAQRLVIGILRNS